MRISGGQYKLWLDPDTGELCCRGRRCRLRPKTAAVLAHLAERPDRLTTRAELLNGVWPDQDVGDHVLTQSIRELRHALGELGVARGVLETVPRRGYRLRTSPRVATGSARRPLRLALGAASVVGSWIIATGSPENPGNGADGSRLSPPPARFEPVTALRGEETFPSISDDGSVVAYLHRTAGQRNDVYVTGPAFAHPVRLTRTAHAEHAPAVSPDGRRVAYFESSGDDCFLSLRPVVGGTARRLTECHPRYLNYADWSPDGELLVYSKERPGGSGQALHLAALDVASGEVRHIDYPAEPERHDFMPRFSPDGRWLAFVRGSQTNYELRVMPAGGGTSTRVTAGRFGRMGYDWTADSSALIVPDRVEGMGALALIAMPSGESSSHVLLPDIPLYPSVASGSGAVVFNQYHQRTAIFRLPTDGSGDPVAVQTSSGRESMPVHAPGGGRYAFVSTRSGRANIWLAGESGESPVRVTDVQSGGVASPAWSPDGEMLLFTHVTEAGRRLKKLDLVSRQVSPVTAAEETVLSGTFSNDGRRVYYDSNRGGVRHIWSAKLDGSDPEVLVRGSHPRTVAGDPHVYFQRTGESGLWRVHPGLGQPEVVYDAGLGGNPYGWHFLDGGVLALKTDDAGKVGLYRFPGKGGGAPELVVPIESDPYDWNFSLEPDGRAVLIALNEYKESDILRLPPADGGRRWVALGSQP